MLKMTLIELDYNFNMFERLAAKVIRYGPIPSHIAVIMDGNRRFAKKNNKSIKEGHESGFHALMRFIEWNLAVGIKELTVYAFSIDNFKRDNKEIANLMDLMESIAKRSEFFRKKGISLRVIGDKHFVSKKLLDLLKTAADDTKHCEAIILNIAFAYTSRIEITNAMRAVLKKEVSWESVDDIDLIEANLFLKSKPELLIRSSGETRLSDFLMWQISKSVIIFTDRLWPELNFVNFISLILLYQLRIL